MGLWVIGDTYGQESILGCRERNVVDPAHLALAEALGLHGAKAHGEAGGKVDSEIVLENKDLGADVGQILDLERNNADLALAVARGEGHDLAHVDAWLVTQKSADGVQPTVWVRETSLQGTDKAGVGKNIKAWPKESKADAFTEAQGIGLEAVVQESGILNTGLVHLNPPSGL
jgi:hypothetical protein